MLGFTRKQNLNKELDNILDQLDRSREINQKLAEQTNTFISSASEFKRQFNEYMELNACNVY